MKAIIRFTIENFRSISDRKSIILVPSEEKTIATCMTVPTKEEIRYLKSAAIYGANSSGKSNLVKGIGMMRGLVTNSVKVNKNEKLPYNPFAFKKSKRTSPTLFELEFVIPDGHFRYGFAYTQQEITEEWLYRIEFDLHETPMFIRSLEGIGVNEIEFPEGNDLESKTNDNRLFISVVGQLGGDLSNHIIEFFDEDLNPLSGLKTDGYNSFSKLMLNRQLPGCEEMLEFFMRVKLGFSGLASHIKEFDPHDLPSDIPSNIREEIITKLSGKQRIDVLSLHGSYSDEGNLVGTSEYDFDEIESAGTKKLFDLAGPIFDSLKLGNILIIDELDAKMHPLMSQELVLLFNDPMRNPNGAQLLFTTHDTNLLSSRLLDRDQIWFTEKDDQEQTDLYCMASIRHLDGTVLEDSANMERNYIQGRYGAIPYIN